MFYRYYCILRDILKCGNKGYSEKEQDIHNINLYDFKFEMI